MALGKPGRVAIQKGVDNLSPFKQGNVSAVIYDDWHRVPKVRLQSDDYVMPNDLMDRTVYVLSSWYTPIAWCVIDDDAKRVWHMTTRDFSQSTKNHKGIMRVAIDNPGFYS